MVKAVIRSTLPCMIHSKPSRTPSTSTPSSPPRMAAAGGGGGAARGAGRPWPRVLGPFPARPPDGVLRDPAPHLALVLPGAPPRLHPAQRLLHAPRHGQARRLEHPAHEARPLARVVLVDPLHLARHRLHGPLQPGLVEVGLRARGLRRLLLSSLGDRERGDAPREVPALAAGTGGHLLGVHGPGEEVEHAVTVGAVELVDRHGRSSLLRAAILSDTRRPPRTMYHRTVSRRGDQGVKRVVVGISGASG